MTKYRKILVAIDLSKETAQVLEAAISLRETHDAELLVVHIVERVSIAYSAGGIIMDRNKFQDELNATAKDELKKYTKQYKIDATQQIISIGHPHTEIHRLAKEHDIDLIVIGSHGRRGFQRLMLGSTANGVLHGATCDVLAVRIK